jgi:general secretion pathway protein J
MRDEAGFTLLELLVALTILALLVTLLSGGLRFGARVWEARLGSSDELSAMEAAQGLMRRIIAAAPASTGHGEEATVLFRGAPASMRFVGPAPALAMPEGLYEIVLLQRNGDLVLTWNAFRSDKGAMSIRAGERVLLSGLSDVQFAYRDNKARWTSNWSARDAPPTLVRVSFDFANGGRQWPDLLVAPPVTAAGIHVAAPAGAAAEE